MRAIPLVLVAALATVPSSSQASQAATVQESPARELQALAADFWAWRASTQPVAGDDIPRIVRPAGWIPDWSRASVRTRLLALAGFEARLATVDTAGWAVPDQVDHRLMASAMARVRWELEVNPAWRTNPLFYIAQTQGAVFDLLLNPGDFDAARSTHVVATLRAVPALVAQAMENLDRANGTFTDLALGELEGVRPRLESMAAALGPHLTGPDAGDLRGATGAAVAALESLRGWLASRVDAMPRETAVGRDAYAFFLREVALVPYAPEELVAMARQEFQRAIAFEVMERQRNRGLPELSMFPDQAAQIAAEARMEADTRTFLGEHGILTVPAWMRHYRNLPIPDYLKPLAHMGVTDDLTDAGRLGEDAVSYIWPPSPALGYFGLSIAKDPRPIIVHEGIPGHYLQMALSWAHEDPIRRWYYDSGANEGIGFYAEEMMLQAGYFDDAPRTREIIYNYARLRALRVEVDVRLATGDFTIAEAGRYLERAVPMPRVTAEEEAAFFASSPGQAITYQIGKIQILRMLSEARTIQGEDFDLQAFHDYVWKNGNVPLALQRWELLGLSDEIGILDRGR
jgi:uncharacterized protein (DUF885 family)